MGPCAMRRTMEMTALRSFETSEYDILRRCVVPRRAVLQTEVHLMLVDPGQRLQQFARPPRAKSCRWELRVHGVRTVHCDVRRQERVGLSVTVERKNRTNGLCRKYT